MGQVNLGIVELDRRLIALVQIFPTATAALALHRLNRMPALAHPPVRPRAWHGVGVDLPVKGRAHRLPERALQLLQGHPILGPPRTSHTRLDRRQIKLQQFAEDRLGRFVGPKQALGLAIRFHKLHQLLRPAGVPQIAQGLGVNREEATGGAILRRHVGDRRAIRQTEVAQPCAAKLNKLADHAFAAQQLGHGQHQISRGGARPQLAN